MDLWYVRGDNPIARSAVYFPVLALIFLTACNSENTGESTTTLPINSFLQKVAAVAEPRGSQAGDQIDSTAAQCLVGAFTSTHCADVPQSVNDAGARVVLLDTGQLSGSYISRLMDGVSTSARWSTISWTPLGPYGKELPGNSSEESVYSTDNVSMSENTILFHFNENPGSTRFSDSSGNSVAATCGGREPSDCPTSGVTGHFNSAVEFSEGTSLSVPANEFQLSLNAITFSVWISPKKSEPGANAQFIFEKRQPSGADLAAYVIAAENGDSLFCAQVVNAAGISAQKCANETPLSDETWHHVAFRFTQNLIDLFVDGRHSDSASGSTLAASNSAGNALVIGADSSASNNFVGLLDEFAIFKRALSDSEIKALFHRGAYSLKVQIRSCMDQSCSANLFEGPDGTKASFFSEESNSSLGEPSFNLASPLTNRYFQYRVDLSRTSADLPPPGFQLFTAGH